MKLKGLAFLMAIAWVTITFAMNDVPTWVFITGSFIFGGAFGFTIGMIEEV